MKIRVLVALLLLGSSVPLLAEPLLKAPGHWAQDYTGRKADPNIRFGTLPNGLRYAIMHNETPTEGVAMRMRIGSGAIEERDDEQGLAHFIEHMAFRGSANIADGDVVHLLERLGLQLGPDTNAFTSQDETVYMFNFPRADATAVDTGLKLFREIGERLTLTPAAIEAEKGVVLSEERLRDTPAYRSAVASMTTILDGTRAVQRWPIGKVETIKAADHDRLARYYRANYRPDNATIVVVGNIDPAALEQKIRAAFSDWKAGGTPDPIDFGKPSGKKTTGEFVADGAPDHLSLVWVGQEDRRAETEVVDREMLVRRIALAILNQRLADRSLMPGSPFVAAQAVSNPSVAHSGSLTELEISSAPEKWREALDAVSDQQRMLLRDGVQPIELQRAITTFRTLLEAKAAAASTRKSSEIADAIVRAANDDRLMTSEAQDLAFLEPALAKITPTEIDEALKLLFPATRPILFRSARQAQAGDPELASALAAAHARVLGPAVKVAAIRWPYTDFGMPGAIVSRSEDAVLGTTTVRFANGTQLIVKPTKFDKDRVLVAVNFGSGRTGVSPSLAHGLWEAQLFPLIGTGKLSFGEITQWAQAAGKAASVGLEAGSRAFVLKGVTRPSDLMTQMQLLAAYSRDPGFRPEAFEKAKSLAPMLAGQLSSNAGAVYARGTQALMVGNDPRYLVLPTATDLQKLDASDLPRLLRQALAGHADVVIVGDVTPEDAIRTTAATFGAGSGAKPDALIPARVSITSRAGKPFVFEHKGRADQAVYGEYFPLPDYFADPRTSTVAQVAAAILRARLNDTVREKLGLTYTPMVGASASLELQGEGYFTAAIETPPANFDSFRDLLASQIRDLATKPASVDELSRAKQPLMAAQRRNLETNGYWLGKLSELTREPRVREQALEQLSMLSTVSLDDVQAFAAKFLAGRPPIVAIAKVGASPASAPRDASAATTFPKVKG
ncbi:MAG TPA: insulinase family protein [Sphingomicrobium sp.]|nr:insulinase family protein [Sphingomicrobium sp.]